MGIYPFLARNGTDDNQDLKTIHTLEPIHDGIMRFTPEGID